MMELDSFERCSSVFSILLSLHIKGYIDHFQQFQVQIGGKFQTLSSVKFHELFNILITCTNCGSLKGIIVHFTWNQLCHDTRAWSPLPRTRCGTNYANIVFTCVYLGDSSADDDARIKSERPKAGAFCLICRGLSKNMHFTRFWYILKGLLPIHAF